MSKLTVTVLSPELAMVIQKQIEGGFWAVVCLCVGGFWRSWKASLRKEYLG